MKKSIGTAALIIATYLSLMPAAPAYAANWVYVTTDPDNTVYYYDFDTIQRSGNQVTFWQKADHSRDKTVKQRETRTRYRYDCAMRTHTLLQLTFYYPDGNNQTFIWNTYEQKTREIIPDTSGEAILETVCR